jgi:hypothetical protein
MKTKKIILLHWTFESPPPLSGSSAEVLKADLKLEAGEVIDAATMSRKQLSVVFFFCYRCLTDFTPSFFSLFSLLSVIQSALF